jgi:predicted MPP superfamily phosphohydrolase
MLLRILVPILLLHFYAGWKISKAISTVSSLPLPWTRFGIYILLALLNVLPFYILTQYFTGTLESLFLFTADIGWKHYTMVFPFWTAFLLVAELFSYYFLLDMAGFIQGKIWNFQSWVQIKSWLQLGILVFFVIYIPIRVYHDTYSVRESHIKLPVPSIPKSLDGTELLFLADIQIDPYTQEAKINSFFRALGENKSDLFLFAGDLVTMGPKYIKQGLELICKAGNGHSTGVLGDHDYWSGPRQIRMGMEKCGWNMMDNAHKLLQIKKARVLVTGITHTYPHKISPEKLKDLLSKAPSADLKILLIHQPAQWIIEEAEKSGYHLFLAGHTHGGQMVLKPFGISLTPSRMENDFFTGYKKSGNMFVVITNGIGVSLAPLRYHAPAEITRIRLQKTEENTQ